MNSDAFHVGLLTASVHLVMEIVFRYRKDAADIIKSVDRFEIVLHLITQELRESYRAVTLFRLWIRYHLFSVYDLICFADPQRALLKIEVFLRKS